MDKTEQLALSSEIFAFVYKTTLHAPESFLLQYIELERELGSSFCHDLVADILQADSPRETILSIIRLLVLVYDRAMHEELNRGTETNDPKRARSDPAPTIDPGEPPIVAHGSSVDQGNVFEPVRLPESVEPGSLLE